MSLTGQLNDLSLGELIEFFCNQRKTGRLKVDYALAPGVFFVEAGELVDAKVGALNGAEAVYFAMTLPSASFDFSAGVRSSRRTISERWPSVVLEGLRRVDEGLPAASSDAFHGDASLDGATVDYLDCVGDPKPRPAAENGTPAGSVAREIDQAFDQAAPTRHPAPPDQAARRARSSRPERAARSEQAGNAASAEPADADAPFSLTVEAATASGGGRRKAVVAAVAAVLVVCAVAAVPLSKRFARKAAPAAAVETNAGSAESAQPAAPAEAPAPAAESVNAVAPTPDFAAEEAARRERESREREARERARRQREDAARRAEEDGDGATAAATPKPATAASGPKSVRVQISYDEAGRVTQAAAVGTSPGAEAYASTAVRVARGRRFPAGKAGTTVVTIPIN